MQLWAHAHRQSFHGGINTNNITESFNNVLRKRYLPLRHDTTVFALTQVLVEVVFPEQQLKYIQATGKQTSTYRSPRYPIPDYLIERPHSVQGIYLLNIERGKSIPLCHIIKLPENGVFKIKRGSTQASEEDTWTVNIPDGNCACPAFQTSHIPCKHMFAILHHHHLTWKWSNLPKSLTEAPHMSLDVQCTLRDFNWEINNCDDNADIPPTTTDVSTKIPVHGTTGTQIYRLQKQIEEVLGQCRTLAFLNNDIPTLEAALEQGKTIAMKLREAATIPGGENCPPTFKTLAVAGVEEFRKSSKIVHRAGAKCKSCYSKGVSQPKSQKCNSSTDILQGAKRREAGRPKLKRAQRRKPVLLRQVSSSAIIRRGTLGPGSVHSHTPPLPHHKHYHNYHTT